MFLVVKKSNDKNIAAIASTSTILGVCALACLSTAGLLGTLGIWQRYRHQKFKRSRQPEYLADELRSQLKLAGVDYFDSAEGLDYVNAVGTLSVALAGVGYDVNAMYKNEIPDLAKQLTSVIKDKIPYEEQRFGKIKIKAADLQAHADEIADEVVAREKMTDAHMMP